MNNIGYLGWVIALENKGTLLYSRVQLQEACYTAEVGLLENIVWDGSQKSFQHHHSSLSSKSLSIHL